MTTYHIRCKRKFRKKLHPEWKTTLRLMGGVSVISPYSKLQATVVVEDDDADKQLLGSLGKYFFVEKIN
jgi:hypothetical protein